MRQMMFSTVFPKGHPREGQPTEFVQKILKALSMLDHNISMQTQYEPKWHTIRAGENWKPGDVFQPKIWSGRPYNTKTINIATPITVAQTWALEKSEHTATFYLEGKPLTLANIEVIAGNDGLELIDFYNWFSKPFSGQIICWSNTLNYPKQFNL